MASSDCSVQAAPPVTIVIFGATGDLTRRPGPRVATVPVSLDIARQVGYESLLYDLFIGDRMPFQRADGIEASWAAVQPFLDLWAKGGKPDQYQPGSFGPNAAETLLERDGRTWHRLAAERRQR
ncbi:hypothetical protein [Rhodopila sp.]|uniref:hypothetical protein n=1 Tax=Rhodopila sp. TaxID=2480087 RepID=UPI003D0A50A5